ncbi:hypothetical protein COO91_06087 [Nostoc flagelliforme CCNUN1]|uniref:Uncharacterized protein n=1 Tax=Nostoc flagelliforme CCNUN1 TaxID=2038116 RepID=A0A2K8SXC6_9NOSO|nr:hypothetical protein COO91_06087 [Nostoc flagelliforme CCNUN1]
MFFWVIGFEPSPLHVVAFRLGVGVNFLSIYLRRRDRIN